jgi:hypothetical protein
MNSLVPDRLSSHSRHTDLVLRLRDVFCRVLGSTVDEAVAEAAAVGFALSVCSNWECVVSSTQAATAVAMVRGVCWFHSTIANMHV